MAMISELTVMAKADSRHNCTPCLLENSLGLLPMVTLRKYLSLQSVTRLQVIVSGSMSSLTNFSISASVSRSGSCFLCPKPNFSRRAYMEGSKERLPFLSTGHKRFHMPSTVEVFSWYHLVSIAAAKRLCAAVMAWMSPVMCKLNSSIGTHCEYPPPAAPPFVPNVGPMDGCRMQVTTFCPRCAPNACDKPIVVVDLPSPKGVGLMPTTTT
mmetsp:Transcript_120998/g.338774  ORF Transcript_120998/g.338774 Transcript_120998/m.338774 type:complete len:211 (+) Transcript_120998:1479-2111(+)